MSNEIRKSVKNKRKLSELTNSNVRRSARIQKRQRTKYNNAPNIDKTLNNLSTDMKNIIQNGTLDEFADKLIYNVDKNSNNINNDSDNDSTINKENDSDTEFKLDLNNIDTNNNTKYTKKNKNYTTEELCDIASLMTDIIKNENNKYKYNINEGFSSNFWNILSDNVKIHRSSSSLKSRYNKCIKPDYKGKSGQAEMSAVKSLMESQKSIIAAKNNEDTLNLFLKSRKEEKKESKQSKKEKIEQEKANAFSLIANTFAKEYESKKDEDNPNKLGKPFREWLSRMKNKIFDDEYNNILKLYYNKNKREDILIAYGDVCDKEDEYIFQIIMEAVNIISNL